jgi:hypothetical protein
MAEFVRSNEVGQVFVGGDDRSFAAAVTAALADGRHTGERVGELAARYSWQAQEGLVRDFYGSVSGYAAHEASGPFPSLDSGLVDPS